MIRALSSFLLRPLADEQVNHFAYEIEKIHHGTPSGIDNTVITYANPVYFVKSPPASNNRDTGGHAETFKVGAPFTIAIGDTGIPAPTKEAVSDVRRLWQMHQVHWEAIFDEIGQIAFMA